MKLREETNADQKTWLEARLKLLEQEKELTRQYDRVCAARLRLPRRRIQAAYSFRSSDGERSLGELFAGRSQLLVYHLMFGEDWDEACKSCAFWVDQLDAIRPHLAARDVELIAVSRAAPSKLSAFADRMGWSFPWFSSQGTTFNGDFGVSFTPEQVAGEERVYNFGTAAPNGTEAQGISSFLKEGDAIYHCYSTYGRGVEPMNAAYRYLDLAPRGRNEAVLPWGMAWVDFHDRYPV